MPPPWPPSAVIGFFFFDGIQAVEHIEAIDGATVFRHACKLGYRVEAA